MLRDVGKRYFMIRNRLERRRGNDALERGIAEIAGEMLSALGYDTASLKPELVDIPGISVTKVPIAMEVNKPNGAPLLWTIVVSPRWDGEQPDAGEEEDDSADILSCTPFAADLRPDHDIPFDGEALIRVPIEELLGRLLYDLDESPRWIIVSNDSQIALIDRNKWNEKRFLLFDLDEIFGRNEESTLQAMAVLLHADSLCPADGGCLLDVLDDNSHKHASGVSRDLKYALRQCIEILGNEVVYDMKERQHVGVFGRDLADELTMLAKIFLMGVFAAIDVAVSCLAKSRSWLSILLFAFAGMLLFMMIPMMTPLDAGIIHVGLCLAGSAMFGFSLGTESNMLLSRHDLV